MIWLPATDGDDRARALFLRHYSSRKSRSTGKRARQFMPPGEKLLLLTVDALAVFGWVKQRYRKDGQKGVYNCLFRNERASGCHNSNHDHCSSRMIGEAMDIAWRVLDARYFGVAQGRRRVFVVADFGGERAGEILFEPASVRRDSQACRAAGEDIAGTLGGGAQSGGFRTTDLDGSGAFVVPTVAYVPEFVGAISDGAHHGGGLNGQDAYTGRVCAPTGKVRRLTPTECARLQGFPDDWNAWLADSHRYRQFGNAVCVPVAQWIANRIMEAPND